MTIWTRFVLAGAGLLALVAVSDTALAQDNFDAGKTGAQLFASDCAICHKSPQSINRNVGGPFGGLDSFLRQHYTASREAAAAITAYLNSVGSGPAAATPRSGKAKRKAADDKKGVKPGKTDDKAKADEKKETKPEEKSGDKPADTPVDKKSDKDKKDSSETTRAKAAG